MNANAHAALGVGSMVGGRYRLDRLLRGDSGSTLYEAVSPEGTRCAVKVLARERLSDRALVDRFVDEGSRAKRIASEHVVGVREVAVDETTHAPFVVTELLDAEDIDMLIARIGRVPAPVAARIVLQAARGLAAARAEGVEHESLEPSEIFLHREKDDRVVVKVADFVGTRRSPEAPNAVRSLGATLWAMLTAGAPISSEGPSVNRAPWVDPALAEVVRTMVQDGEGQPSLAALVPALSPFIDGREWLGSDDLRLAGSNFAKSHGSPTANPDLRSPEERTEQMSLVGETLGARYRLDRMLGHGGMGAVYEAKGPNDARVAVKVILGDNRKPDSVRRFVREAKTTTAIESPYVVRVLDIDGDASRGVPYIVMELLRGTDLEQTIRTHGALEPATVARLFVQACVGLAAAHERGVVHRDIKPANIFLHREDDGRITAKICDFGIAKQVQRERDAALHSTDLTHTGSMVGSPPYMSPEQARSSKDIDARSDVWSLGAALYEALSGRRVWEGCESIGELMAAIIREPVPKLESVAPWVDPGLAAVVARALEKDLDRRFPTMKAFADALEPFACSPESFDVVSVRSVSGERRSLPRVSSSAGELGASFSTTDRSKSSRKGWLTPIALLAVVAGGIVMIATRAPDPAPTPKPVVSAEPPKAPASTSVPAPSASASASSPPPVASTPVPSATASVHVVAVPKSTVAPKASTKKKPNDDPSVPNIF